MAPGWPRQVCLTPIRRATSARFGNPAGTRLLVVSRSQPEPKIGLVVANRNGATQLERLFASLEHYNTYKNFSLFVIDHGSTDSSFEICTQWAARLPIKFVDRRINASISASNNYGARLAHDCDLLLFLSHDVELCMDVLPCMAGFMEQDDCCILGIRLVDGIDEAREPNSACSEHLGIAFDDCAPGRVFLPYEVPATRSNHQFRSGAWEVPAVAGGLMMVRRSEFESIGGFDEGYFNGCEDVDLCLLARQKLGKRIFCIMDHYALRRVEASGSTHQNHDSKRIEANYRRLESRTGALLRSETIADMFRRPPSLRPRPTRIAFAVTAANMSGEAGDYFTAFELGGELSRIYGWHVAYLEQAQWYDLEFFDIVVAMRHDFDPSRIQTANPHLVLIGWARNWFDLWLTNPHTEKLDQIWASSSKGAQALEARLGRQTPVIRIAANATRFGSGKPSSSLQSDYCFTGSYFDAPRDIISALDPEAVPFEFAIYGHNWEKVPALAAHSRGPLPYDRMPDVYASTKIVIDNSNSTTLKWGALNARVFDALASGALVLTNNSIGAHETFGGLLPSWSSREQLTDLLQRYLGDDEARSALVEKLRSIVLRRHSYALRAQDVHDALLDLIAHRDRVGIDIPGAPTTPEHQAVLNAITSAVDRQTFLRARHEIGGQSADQASAGDAYRITILLPGFTAGRTRLRQDQANILLLLGSPDDVAIAELDRYSLVLVADSLMAAALSGRTRAQVRCLFDKAGTMARNVIRFDEDSESIILIDIHPLRLAVTTLLKEQAALCSSLISARRMMADPFRLSTPAIDPVSSTRQARLLFYPDYRETNPYQQLLYDGVGPALSVGPGTIDDAISLIEEHGSVVIFHLHWTSVIVGADGSEIEVRNRVVAFLGAVDRFLASGGRLFWTVHNRLSHETPFPHIEAELYRELARRAATVHVHSQLAPALLADIVQFSPGQVLVASHGNYVGSLPDHLSPAEARERLGLRGAPTTFLFFGQIRSYKGVQSLLDAFATIGGDDDVHLIVAGTLGNSANDGDQDAIRSRLATTPGVSAHLKFIPDDDVQLYFRAADAVILPYRAVLTSGSAILAQSFGRPILAPSLGLITELVRDGREGILYDPRDSDGLLGAMRRFVGLDAETRTRMGAAARAMAERLSWEETSKAIYVEAVAGAVGKAEIIGAGEGDWRCFVRHGAQEHDRSIAVWHHDDVEKTNLRIASIMAQTEVPVSLFVVSTC